MTLFLLQNYMNYNLSSFLILINYKYNSIDQYIGFFFKITANLPSNYYIYSIKVFYIEFVS